MIKYEKMVRGMLAVMLVVSFLLAVVTLAPIAASASGGGGDPQPEDTCSNYDCYNTGKYCEYNGQIGYIEHCCYQPWPDICDYCPSPCCWDQCHWW